VFELDKTSRMKQMVGCVKPFFVSSERVYTGDKFPKRFSDSKTER